jgi:hypothetical protein
MSYSCCKTELEAAADDPVASVLLHRGCRTDWYGVIDAALSLPLHSIRSVFLSDRFFWSDYLILVFLLRFTTGLAEGL